MADNEELDVESFIDSIESELETPSQEPQEDQEEDSNHGITSRAMRSYRITAEELGERRQNAYDLRQRGWTMTKIAQELGVSYITIKRDLEEMQRALVLDIANTKKEDFMADAISSYDNVIRESWNVYSRTRDDEIKLKALNQIRMTQNDRRKAMQDTGIIKKESQVVEHINVGFIEGWSEDNRKEAVKALLAMNMSEALPPTPDIQEAEVVEEAPPAIDPEAAQDVEILQAELVGDDDGGS